MLRLDLAGRARSQCVTCLASIRCSIGYRSIRYCVQRQQPDLGGQGPRPMRDVPGQYSLLSSIFFTRIILGGNPYE